jgi:hypothetical protein
MLLRITPGAMLAFYRDTFASQAAKDQPIYDMQELFAWRKPRRALRRTTSGPGCVSVCSHTARLMMCPAGQHCQFCPPLSDIVAKCIGGQYI